MFVYSSCVECFNICLRNSCPSLLLLTRSVADAARFTTADFPLLCNVWLISLYNLMLYSISALHTSFYNLHQFFYLNPCTCKMLVAYWTVNEYSSSPGTYFRWSKQIQATRTSAKIFNQIENTHLLVIIYYCLFLKDIKLNL